MPAAPLPRRVEAVFFDAGDTLLAAQPSFQQRFHRVVADHGERFEEATVGAAYAQAVRRAVWPLDWGDERGQRKFWHDFYTGILADLGARGDHARLADALFRVFNDPASYRLFPDARDVLDHLAGRGLTLGVVSNFEPWLTDVLELEGVHDRFAAVAISGVLGVAKPDPAIFHAALGQARVPAEATVYVGDSPTIDVVGARAAGLHPVLIDRFDRHPDADGCPRITTLADLPTLLPATPR
jgi:putative hydrolase of the HAD superfamily